jgi:hypothetical protein
MEGPPSRQPIAHVCRSPHEDLHHQIGKSVYYLRLVTKTFGRIDHPKDFDHSLHAIQAAKRGAHLCQHDQPNLARRVIAFLYGEVLAHLDHSPIDSGSTIRIMDIVPTELEGLAADRAREALDHYNQAVERLKSGDWAGFGTELDAMRELLEDLSWQSGGH